MRNRKKIIEKGTKIETKKKDFVVERVNRRGVKDRG